MRLFIFLILLLVTGWFNMVDTHAQNSALVTRWAADVTPDNVLPEYPRPQLVREQWLNLNGFWDYAIAPATPNDAQPAEFDGQILVPFAIESMLSGVQQSVEGKRLWYRRTFTAPEEWAGQHLLLHFGAVDWLTSVSVNGVEIGQHRGGYDAFSFDITNALRPEGEQEIVVSVFDPTDLGTQPRGKQVRQPDGIWYTPTTGIWQTVWIEPVPAVSIAGLKMETDIDAGVLRIQVNLTGNQRNTLYTLTANAGDGSQIVATATGTSDDPLQLVIEDAKWWSPDLPFLYDLHLILSENDAILDKVSSYFGMREIAIEPDSDGIPRLMLNHQPIFHFGLLDQGFWPDGLYTAPTDEALRYDIEITQQLGFNMIRKHVKVEPDRWYYWADRMGMLVWQDMPSGDAYVDPGEGEISRSQNSAEQFELELQRMIDTHYNHPSIVMWVVFNEGWGQYDTARLSEWVEIYDPTRLVNSVSGWNDVGVGNVYDIHRYPGPEAPALESARAAVLGEFGGLGLPLAGHTWLTQDNWGYRQYEDAEALQDAYINLIQNLRHLIETQGLAAAVYTQTTDVETEVNGMMTYDRELIKMDVEQIRVINSTLYSPLVGD